MVSKKNISKNSKKNILIYILFSLIILILLFFLIRVNNNLKVLNNQYQKSLQQISNNNLVISKQNKLIQEKDNNISKLISEKLNLLNNIQLLNNNISTLTYELDNSKEQNKNIQEDYNDLVDNLVFFESQVKESMSWFKNNSNINEVEIYNFKKNIKKAVSCNYNSCTINTTYLNFINRNNFKLQYASDLSITGEDDKLQSISEFLENKKGDCEDFSLLFAAELRYLEDYINNLHKIPKIEICKKDDYYKKYIFQKTSAYYRYLQGFSKLDIPTQYIYPYVVCGNLYNYQTTTVNAHCVIMLTNFIIKDSKDITKLKGSYLFEPQTGVYIGKIDVPETISYKNSVSSSKTINYNIGFIDSNNNPESKIYEFITSNDLFYNDSIYTGNNPLNSKWLSYNFFLNKLKEYNIN